MLLAIYQYSEKNHSTICLLQLFTHAMERPEHAHEPFSEPSPTRSLPASSIIDSQRKLQKITVWRIGPAVFHMLALTLHVCKNPLSRRQIQPLKQWAEGEGVNKTHQAVWQKSLVEVEIPFGRIHVSSLLRPCENTQFTESVYRQNMLKPIET